MSCFRCITPLAKYNSKMHRRGVVRQGGGKSQSQRHINRRAVMLLTLWPALWLISIVALCQGVDWLPFLYHSGLSNFRPSIVWYTSSTPIVSPFMLYMKLRQRSPKIFKIVGHHLWEWNKFFKVFLGCFVFIFVKIKDYIGFAHHIWPTLLCQ